MEKGIKHVEAVSLRRKEEMKKQLSLDIKVLFNIGHGLDTGKAYIREAYSDTDNYYVYKLEVMEGSFSMLHRNEKGELWVNDFEISLI